MFSLTNEDFIEALLDALGSIVANQEALLSAYYACLILISAMCLYTLFWGGRRR